MGEKRILHVNNSRKVYVIIYLMMIIVAGLIIYIKVMDLPLNKNAFIGAISFIILGILITEIHRKRISYEVTPLYLIHNKGILSRKSKKILLESIVDIDLNQKLWQRLLGYGSVEVHAASGANIIKVKNINKPGRFVDILEKQVGEIVNKSQKKTLKKR